MKQKLSFFLMLTLSIAYSSILTFADVRPFELTVSDSNGPVNNAQIVIDGTTLITGPLGSAIFNLEDGDYNFTITAPGRSQINDMLTVSSSSTSQSISLTEDPSGIYININPHVKDNLKDEIDVFMATYSLTDFSKIKSIKITGGEISQNDIVTAFHGNTAVKGNLEIFDFSETTFENNTVPGPWTNGFTALKRLVFPDSVTTFDTSTFADSSALEEIVFPNQLTTIAGSSFIRCSKLKNLTFPDSLESIGGFAFAYCNELESIHFKDQFASLDPYAFNQCSTLKDVYVTSSAPDIAISRPFLNRSQPVRLHVPSGSESIFRAYSDGNTTDKTWWSLYIEDPASPNPNLISNSVNRISDNRLMVSLTCDEPFYLYYAFVAPNAGLPSIDTSGQGITNPNALTRASYTLTLDNLTPGNKDLWVYIKDDFGNFSAPTRIEIPAYFAPIDLIIDNHQTGNLGQEFENFYIETGIDPDAVKFKSITIKGNTLTTPELMGLNMMYSQLQETLWSYDLSQTSFENNTIPDQFFATLYEVTSIKLPSDIQIIGEAAFSECYSLEAITLPASVQEIKDDAFVDAGITKIYSNCTTPPTVNNSILDGFTDVTLFVPHGSFELYRLAPDGDLTDNKWYGATLSEQHTITIETMTGGTVTSNTAFAYTGDSISLTVSPETGKTLISNSLTYTDSAAHVINGTTFTMPDADVLVKANFETIVLPPAPPIPPSEPDPSSGNSNTVSSGGGGGDSDKHDRDEANNSNTSDNTTATTTTSASATATAASTTSTSVITNDTQNTVSNKENSDRNQSTSEQPVQYGDIENHWAKKAIENVTEKGVFSGVQKDQFSPDTEMTRGMLVTVISKLWILENGALPLEIPSSFSDISKFDYFAPYANWAAKNNITSGISNNLFAPNLTVNREQMVVMIYNYAKFAGLTNGTEKNQLLEGYSDNEAISNWAKEAFNWALSSNIVSGKINSTLDPKGTATRAEVASVLNLILEKMAIQ